MLPFPVDPEKDTVCDVIRRWAEIQPDALAFIEENRQPLTYRALVDAMEGVRTDLNKAGFGRGDRIALVHPGGQPMAPLILGIVSCATLLPLNPNQTTEEFEVQLRDRRADALVLEPDVAPAALEAAKALGLPVFFCSPSSDGLRMADGNALVAIGGERGLAESSDIAVVFSTSGTTWAAKLVPIRQRLVLLRALSENDFFERSPADVCLCPQRLYYANGVNQMMSSLCCGGTLAQTPSFTVEIFFQYLREFGLTCVSASMPFLHRIHDSMTAFEDHARDHSLRYIRATSGFIDPTVADALEAFFGVPIVENYSSSETCRICCNPLRPKLRKRGTVGPPSDCEVRIRSLDGAFLQNGECGEILVRGPRIIEGYENDPEASAVAFVDGWFRTGDEGFFDEDGYLTLTGRIKEMINRGGEKVSPAEVDAAVIAHPEIIEAAAFPIPHPTLGEEVAVAVVRAPGGSVTEGDLTGFLLGKLAGFKVPRRIVFVADIPKSDAGRVQRYTLSEALGVGLDPDPERSRKSGRRPSPLEYRLRRLWRRALGNQSVELDDNYFLMGGDSLQAVELFLAIERSFKRRLPLAALFEAGTVAEMARLIEDMEPQGAIVPIQPEGDRPPFFCIHGMAGEAISYYHLSKHLGTDQPFYGIQAIGWDTASVPFTKANDMAAHYVDEIRKIQPQGPYFISGQSFGGRIAVYMANILKAAGEEVAFLALFDTVFLGGRQIMPLGQWLEKEGAPAGIRKFKAALPYIRFRLERGYQHLYDRALRMVLFPVLEFYRASGTSLPLVLCRPDRCNRLMRLEVRHMPTYDGDAVYFRAENDSQSMSHSDVRDAWNQVIKGKLKYIPITGTHKQMLMEPHAQSLAAKLAEELKRARLK